MLVFLAVVLGLALRGMSAEERVRFGRAILGGLLFVKDAITKPPAGGEPFYEALKARTSSSTGHARRLGRQHRAADDER